jgi:hypothetical protein
LTVAARVRRYILSQGLRGGHRGTAVQGVPGALEPTTTLPQRLRGRRDVYFHHDSDLSGIVHIVMCTPEDTTEVEVPGQALLEFMAAYVMGQRISALKRMTPTSMGFQEQSPENLR